MAKTVLDAIKRLEAFENELLSSMPAISKEVAGLFVSEKVEQIKKTGIGNYKTKKYSARYLRGKELNRTGREFIERKVRSGQQTNWKELRDSQGLQTNYVDVNYSGQMLNSTGIIRTNTSQYRFYVIIGGRNREARMKLMQNKLRYGAFLYPNQSQISSMRKRGLYLIGKIYKRILLT